MQVLVVEDNQDLAKLFCDLLEVMGCQTEMAFNAHSALENAKKTHPDLVFCDLRLPGEKSGLDFARALRADSTFAETLLIAVTGYSDAEEDKRAYEAGFQRVFQKPVKFAQMQQVLDDYQKGVR